MTVNKRTAAILIVALLLALCGGTAVALTPRLDAALGHYPGALRLADSGWDVTTLADGAISRQAVFQTQDAAGTVKAWYADPLHIATSNIMVDAAGDCVVLAQADLTYRLEHTFAVVVCTLPTGTRVVINEKVRLLR